MPVWWNTLVILTLQRLRQENGKFKDSLGYSKTPFLKYKKPKYKIQKKKKCFKQLLHEEGVTVCCLLTKLITWWSKQNCQYLFCQSIKDPKFSQYKTMFIVFRVQFLEIVQYTKKSRCLSQELLPGCQLGLTAAVAHLRDQGFTLFCLDSVTLTFSNLCEHHCSRAFVIRDCSPQRSHSRERQRQRGRAIEILGLVK